MAVVLMGVVLGITGCVSDAPGAPDHQATALTHTQHPTNSVLDLDGHAFELFNKQNPSIKVIVFTRTDCPISNRFAPEINRLYGAYHPRGVQFFLVYVDPQEQPDAIRTHLNDYGYPCPGLRDPKHTLVHRCSASITPEAVVFGLDGAITYQGRINDLYVALGQSRTKPTTHDLEDAIEATVLGKPVATPKTNAIGCLIVDLER
jgi:hypothetical protein